MKIHFSRIPTGKHRPALIKLADYSVKPFTLALLLMLVVFWVAPEQKRYILQTEKIHNRLYADEIRSFEDLNADGESELIRSFKTLIVMVLKRFMYLHKPMILFGCTILILSKPMG